MSNLNFALVLGYGVYTSDQTNYRQKYLEPVLNNIVRRNSDLVITCGGHSNPKHPQLSEAESIRDLFLEIKPELSSKIIIEVDSLTTPGSLENCQKIISQQYPDFKSITIYSDSCRVPKIFYLCLSLFVPKEKLSEIDRLTILSKLSLQNAYDFSQSVEMSYQNFTVVGIPLSDNSTLISHQIISSMVEMHSFDYPDLHQQFVDWRKQQWGISE